MKSRAEQVLERKKRELALGTSAVEEEDIEQEIVDANDPDLFKEAQKKAQRRKERKEQVFKDLLSTTQGREFVSDFLVECDILGDPHVPNSPDSTAKNIGLQNAGRWWLKMIFDICPDKYPKMLKEAKERLEE